VQDPLSFRVAPQVHGAFRELLAFAGRAVETELNSMSDNPLVSVEDATLVHNGNFHPMVLALAFDALRGAIAHVGQLSDRRMSHLWDAFFNAAGATGTSPLAGAVPEAFGISLRFPAASVSAQLKQLAAPVTLDIAPLDRGVEDHATAAPLSVRATGQALGLLADVLAVELLLARDVLATMASRPAMGADVLAALGTVDEAVGGCSERTTAAVHQAVRARVGRLLPQA